MDQWRESFWFGITTVDPNQITTEWVNEQFEQNNRSTLPDLLYVAVRCQPGMCVSIILRSIEYMGQNYADVFIFRGYSNF